MTVFTYSQDRQNFSSMLELASKEGQVIIKRRDGKLYKIRPESEPVTTPFNIKGIKLNLSAVDIVKTVRESRKR